MLERMHFAVAAVAGLSLVACGDAMTSEPAPLGHIDGTVDNTAAVTVSDPAALHVTFVWLTDDKTGPIGTDVPITTSFPSSFTLGLLSAPPAGAADISAAADFAFHAYVAEIGAYDDTNGNGHYDSADKLLGVATRIRLVYLTHEDELAGIDKMLPGGAKLGFNLFVTKGGSDCKAPLAGVACNDQAFVPLTSSIDIDFSNDAEWE